MSAATSTAWIVDASVALKWFMPAETESDSDLARSAIGRILLKTTSLAMYEVGNRLSRTGGMTSSQVEKALTTMIEICGDPVQLSPADFRPATEIASKNAITFYDASYVAIARRMNRTVLTADSDLLRPGLGVDLSSALG